MKTNFIDIDLSNQDFQKFRFVAQISGLASWQLNPIMLSHGWINLPPFRRFSNGFIYSFFLEENFPVSVLVKREKKGVSCFIDTQISITQQKLMTEFIDRILSLDFPIQNFRLLCKERGEKDFLFLSRRGWGRMLRSATPWEDAVKTLCTTNASWSHTVKMCSELVELGGAVTQSGLRTFPAPKNILETIQPEKGAISLGYRLESLRQLADRSISRDSWMCRLVLDLPEEELKERISSWRGFGPYATQHLMVLLGFHSYLPVDREVGKYIGVHSPGKRFKPGSLPHFDSWGEYRFTAYKLTRVLTKMNWIGS